MPPCRKTISPIVHKPAADASTGQLFRTRSAADSANSRMFWPLSARARSSDSLVRRASSLAAFRQATEFGGSASMIRAKACALRLNSRRQGVRIGRCGSVAVGLRRRERCDPKKKEETFRCFRVNDAQSEGLSWPLIASYKQSSNQGSHRSRQCRGRSGRLAPGRVQGIPGVTQQSSPAALCDFGSQGCRFEPCRVQ